LFMPYSIILLLKLLPDHRIFSPTSKCQFVPPGFLERKTLGFGNGDKRER
jgi:hypothetical protein